MTLSKLLGAAAAALLSVALVGCTPQTPAAQSEGAASGQESSGTEAGSGCDVALPDDLAPFSSDLVTEPIPDRAVYGDGSELSFTTSLGADLAPGFELLKFVGDAPTSYTAGNWEDAGDGRYTTALNVFDSDLDGQEGLIKVTAFPEGVTFDGERYEGDLVVLGIYCITFAVE